MGGLSHFDGHGNAWMVDVGEKEETERVAVAHGFIRLNEAAWEAVETGGAKKGDVLGTARLAGIMGAKKASELIPLCHMVMLTHCSIELVGHPEVRELEAVCTVRTCGKTGVEMEALTGVQAALLTIYDMLKAVDRSMSMSRIELLEKEGGRSGHYKR